MRSFILGTDWWTDCDDAVALRLLTRAVKARKVRLLGIVLNACFEYSVSSIKGFLLADGLTDVPLGLDREATDFGGAPSYQARLTKNLHPLGTNDEAESALSLYRRLLAGAKEKVELIEIGYPQVLSALLESEGDSFSPLCGADLVKQKVSKIWVMAGKWDKNGERENNFCRNKRASHAAEAFCRLCPVPVTFLGWEVGFDVFTGGSLPKSDHLAHVMEDHRVATHREEKGRSSWDPMLMLLALIGNEEKAGYKTVRGYATVDKETGANFFKEDENGSHAYVIKEKTNAFYEEAIDALL